MFEKQNNNNPNDIIFFTRMHWIIFFWPVLSLCVALAIVHNTDLVMLEKAGYGAAALALLWTGMTWMTYYFSSLTIKKIMSLFVQEL
ncbi:transmembrane protein [Legionella sainthelensi]|nr:transmembrane protein [Legionella sainthelensi]